MIKAYKTITLDEDCIIFAKGRPQARFAVFKCLDECYYGYTFGSVGRVLRDKDLDKYADMFCENRCYMKSTVIRRLEEI